MFYYNRNSGTGANDAIDKENGLARPVDILQQFGGSLGGPIVSHRAWYFVDYEQQREKNPITAINPGFTGLDETDFGVPAGTPLPAPSSTFPVPSALSQVPADPANSPVSYTHLAMVVTPGGSREMEILKLSTMHDIAEAKLEAELEALPEPERESE